METRNRKKSDKSVFVTVGTTKFEKLIQTMCAEDTLKVNIFFREVSSFIFSLQLFLHSKIVENEKLYKIVY